MNEWHKLFSNYEIKGMAKNRYKIAKFLFVVRGLKRVLTF